MYICYFIDTYIESRPRKADPTSADFFACTNANHQPTSANQQLPHLNSISPQCYSFSSQHCFCSIPLSLLVPSSRMSHILARAVARPASYPHTFPAIARCSTIPLTVLVCHLPVSLIVRRCVRFLWILRSTSLVPCFMSITKA
jgi:hypothetical protein